MYFPDWWARFGWRATSQREDRVDGRLARTVYYARGDTTLPYTIVPAPALRMPTGAAVRVTTSPPGDSRAQQIDASCRDPNAPSRASGLSASFARERDPLLLPGDGKVSARTGVLFGRRERDQMPELE